MKVAGKRTGVVLCQRLERGDVERLQRVGTVRRIDAYKYAISIAIVEEIHSHIAAVAVDYKLSPSATSFLLSVAVKNLL